MSTSYKIHIFRPYKENFNFTCNFKTLPKIIEYIVFFSEITKNPKSTSFIFQAISMAVQRGNVQCVQGAYGESAFEELDEIFYILQPNCIF